MPQSENSTHNTPLAPSVEKAYYRKCIQLKRRLNEIEADNDSKKIKVERLNRSILKMRLERAFLLDELRKRMQHNVDGSEGSGSDGAVTPPPDRPHRDKRRRPDSGRQAPPTYQQQPQQSAPQPPSQAERDDAPESVQINGNNTTSTNGADEREPINRSVEATGEEVTAGPSIIEDANVRRLLNKYPDFARPIKNLIMAKYQLGMHKRQRKELASDHYKVTMEALRQKYKNAHQSLTRTSTSPRAAAKEAIDLVEAWFKKN